MDENVVKLDSPLGDRLSPQEIESLRREAHETRKMFREILRDNVASLGRGDTPPADGPMS